MPKINELCVTSSLIRPGIIIICESWLTQLVSDNQVFLPNYSAPFRQDRCDGRRGGGVAVYVHDSLLPKRINSIVADGSPAEDVWILFSSMKLLIIALYIPPNLTSKNYQLINDRLAEGIEQTLEQISDLEVIIAGDLNNHPIKEIQDALNLSQIVTCPTRGNAVLDKVLIDDSLSDIYSNATVGPSLGNSDHNSIHIPTTFKAPTMYHMRKVYDLRYSHMENFRCFLRSYPWQNLFLSQTGMEDKCNRFYEVIHEAISLIPYTVVPFTQKDKAWITPLIKSLINKRFDAFRNKDFALYNHYKKKVKLLIDISKQKWLRSTKTTSNGLWKICKDALNLSKNSTLSSLMHSFSSTTDAAENINEEFCKNFSPSPDWNSLHSALNSIQESDKWSPEISVQSIETHLKKLKINKAPGNDGLFPRLLSEAHNELAPPICHLIALSFEESVVPSRWKAADVTPIPKKRNPSIGDLRPVSILPTVSKIMEAYALASIKEKLVNLYGPSQFGFRPHCSTELAHIRAHDFVTTNLDDSNCIAVLILSFDMHKAFDYIRHDSLLLPLADGSLTKDFLIWCANFLRNRTQRVRLSDSTLSSFRKVTSGVPQGSILAPFLFSTHMRSLESPTPFSLTIKYADDVMVIIPIYRSSNVDETVQNEISYVENWCLSHGMKLNVSKTKSMLCKKHSISTTLTTPLCSQLKILGIIYDDNLTWNAQVDYITKNAYRRCFLLRNLKRILSKEELLNIYHAFILTTLEYCSALFVGLNKKEAEKLERVRRKCHRIICGPGCNCGSFTPLFVRRYHHALLLFKSMKHPQHILHDLFPPTLSHSSHFLLPRIKTLRRHSSFVPYCISLSNRIGF